MISDAKLQELRELAESAPGLGLVTLPGNWLLALIVELQERRAATAEERRLLVETGQP